MGFNPPVPQRDSDWEIRVAVLLSLFFQVLLFLVGPTRKRTANPMVRFACWSCYLLADWVADLALGLLVNNLGNIGGNGSSSSSSLSSAGVKRGGVATTVGSGSPGIFAFWTPFLLIHLGGQDTITAYSIEDNELWLRHLIGLLFQLFAACVVFSCSIEGNPLIPATVVMLVAGVIKYGERTYSLYSGSVDGVLASILPAPNPGPNYARLMNVFSSMERAGLDVKLVTANGVARQFQQDQSSYEVSRLRDDNKKPEEQAYYLFTIFRSVCYDINLGHRERETSQAFFLDRVSMTASYAMQVIELELNFMYDMVHTKEPVAHTKAGCIFRLVSTGCIAYSAVAFFHLDKASIRRVDVDITYALLLGALALDTAALAMLIFCSNWTLVFLLDKSAESSLLNRLGKRIRSLRPKLRRWSERTPQLNLISYCLGKLDGNETSSTAAGRHLWRFPRVIRALGRAAHMLGAGAVEIFDDIFFVRREPLKSGGTEDIINFVFTELKDAAKQVRQSTVAAGEEVWGPKAAAKAFRKDKHKDVEEMRKACSFRGEKALNDVRKMIPVGDDSMRKRSEKQGQEEAIVEDDTTGDVVWDILMDSVIDRDFDESLLMWHIATDLCLYDDKARSSIQPVLSSPLPTASCSNSDSNRWMSISKTLSEYLLYLLVKQPKILAASAGVGQMAYQDTCAEARRLFESAAAAMSEPDHEDAQRMLVHARTSVDPEMVKGGRSKSVLFPACIIAKELRKLDKDKKWKLVARVWMEMLTYAAAKCKGTTHVHQLARGGELITMVWLLMAHMGIGNIYRKTVQEDATPKLIIGDQ